MGSTQNIPVSPPAREGRLHAGHEKGPYSARIQFAYKSTLLLILLAAVGIFAAGTWHWPLVGDAPLLHYVVFLAEHGRVPYRDIVDPNMPGTYLVEWSVMHFFGSGALTWRVFDFALMLAATACMAAICFPWDWFAGLFAGGILTLIHGRDGLIELGQRDLVMTVFLLAAYVFLFSRVRNPASRDRNLVESALFGLFVGCAASIKPTALLLLPLLLLLSSIALVRRGRPLGAHIAASLFGAAVPGIAILAYLIRVHALSAFVDTMVRLDRFHLQLWHRSYSWLALHAISSVLLPLVLIWLPVAATRKRWKTWEGAALYSGVAFGILSFILQGKGYPYHRYPSEAFLLLLIGLDCTHALQESILEKRMLPRLLAICGLGFGVAVIGVGSARQALRYKWRSQEYDAMLQSDLNHLGGRNLSGHVQCLDMASGCLDTLLAMHLVQSTGNLYDCYLFWPGATGEEAYYRKLFWSAIRENPPRVFIVNSKTCAPATLQDGPYGKLGRWPQFAQYLAANYQLYADRLPPHPVLWTRDPSPPVGYRIYVRK